MDNRSVVVTDPGGLQGNGSLGTSSVLPNVTQCILNITLNATICDNTSQEAVASPHVPPHPLWLTIFLGLLAGAISVVTIFGNIIVLLSFGIERSIRQPTNYFLASLAVSDLLIGTFSMPLFTQYLLLDYWPLGPWLCDLWLSLDWTVCLTSQYTVFLITMDRFLSVKIPAKYRNWRTERKVLVMIAVTWVLPTLVFFTAVIGWQYFVPEGRTVLPETCEVQFMSDPLFTFVLTIVYYWMTLIVMCVLYAGIYKVALTLQRKSDAKHKKLQHTMELAIEHTAAKVTASNSSDSIPQAVTKAKKQSVVNNKNPTTVTTTSFVKKNNTEKDEDRSSSPAFASDEENSSSQGTGQTSKTPLTANSKPPKMPDKGFINNALQTDSSKTNIKPPSYESACSDEPDTNLLMPTVNRKDIKSDFISEFEPSTQVTDIDNIFSTPPPEDHSSVPLIQNDVLKGIRFIDEKSFSNLAGDNVKLLSESQLSENATEDTEGTNNSPIWRRRNSLADSTICQVESIHVRVPLASQDTFGDKSDQGEQMLPSAHDSNTLGPNDARDSSEDRGMQRLTAGGRRRRKDGRLQTFVKSVRSRNSRRRNRRERKSKSENRARKALRTITLILGAFVVCWTPYHIMVFVIAIAGWDGINVRFYSFTYWLCYLNSPINPFCYAFANAQFKRTFLRIFKLDWHRT